MDKELTTKEKEAIMRWKLGLGSLNNVLQGKSPIPEKTKKAERIDALKGMPTSDVSTLDVQISIEATTPRIPSDN